MGYDSSVYLIYGVRIGYSRDDSDEAWRLMQLIIPDLIGENGEDDVWGCMDEEPHVNGYYCLNFTDHFTGESEIFIACWFHEHHVTHGDDCKEVEFPSTEKMERFQQWCTDNNIEQPTFYTKTYESV